MQFIADFHVHSKYSRATAKNLDLEHLYIAAQMKGITVVGSGDFTHPGWFSEIREKLEPSEPGLFRLKKDLAELCDEKVPRSCRSEVRFILSTEISNIYKKNDRTRKNHNLVFFPDLASVEQFNGKLDTIGNLKSDGRPILGLDAKHLLEILLDVSEEGFLIPAHIWTPWFSLLGSKSGFDSLDECFEDLSSYIFAAETGLSSDPTMNRYVSGLDRLTLVSNSDAHSPFNLGREANRFNTDLSYTSIKSAMKTGDPEKFLGTYEFYPEEGKYHFDGHRKCNICYHPKESVAENGVCPVCKKPLTLGVLYRVKELADRETVVKSENLHPFDSIIPLTDILSEIYKVGPKSKKVATQYDKAIKLLGPEFNILSNLDPEELNTSGTPLLGEAIKRMRQNRIHISPGYDGEYGKIKIFEEGERRQLSGQKTLFSVPTKSNMKKKSSAKISDTKTVSSKDIASKKNMASEIRHQNRVLPSDPKVDVFGSLNSEQRKAVKYDNRPLLIAAGPGTGKTRTLTHKIAYLMKEKNISPDHILAVTFTNKAAQEMKERLSALLLSGNPLPDNHLPMVCTFHAFGYTLLSREAETKGLPPKTILDETDRHAMLSEIVKQSLSNKREKAFNTNTIAHWIVTAKQQILGPEDELGGIVEHKHLEAFSLIYRAYQETLSNQDLLDYEDLIMQSVRLLENENSEPSQLINMFTHIFVDEYQDLNHGQYRIIQALSSKGKGLCVIGDPHQSIYGFRGSDCSYFNRFLIDFPDAERISLTQNYRSTETILESSYQIIKNQQKNSVESRVYSGINGMETIGIIISPTEKSEAVSIGKVIEEMVGGTGFHSDDFNTVDFSNSTTERSFSDFAVLYRTQQQSQIIADVLEKANIPCQVVSRNSLLSEKGIREMLSYFKLMEQCGTFPDIDRILGIQGSGFGSKTIASLRKWYYKRQMPLNEALESARRFPIPGLQNTSQLKLDRLVADIKLLNQELADTSIVDKLKKITQIPFIHLLLKQNKTSEAHLSFLFTLAKSYQDDAVGFLTAITLQTDTDIYDPRAEKVSLMTMHAAKGLEFPVVFITGCENGLIPYVRSEDIPSDIEEEQRLFYVAMTRAKEYLYFTWSKQRMIYGRKLERNLSPFVNDIEERLLNHKVSSSVIKKKKSGQTQLKLF